MTEFVATSLQLAHWRPADSPKSREGREGMFMFLHKLTRHGGERVKQIKHTVCPCLSTSATVVGGVLAERLRASRHSGGGLAGVSR